MQSLAPVFCACLNEKYVLPNLSREFVKSEGLFVYR